MSAYTIERAIRNIDVLQEPNKGNNSIQVAIRLIFLRVGELDTLAEIFEAHVAIEARWFLKSKDDDNQIISSLSTEDQIRLNNGNTIKLPKDFSENNWHPQLFLLNVRRDRDEDIKYSMKKYNSRVQIREFRDVHGKFYSKFDLHYFPTDIQELNVSIGSALFDTEVTLEADPNRASGINREAFVGQQEWNLYDHIEIKTKFIKGFLFHNDDDDQLDTPGHERKRSILSIACHAARRAKYFYWNGYCLIFLITIIAFSSFAIPPGGTQHRINIVCTLLLTSIAYLWTINNSLPNISYLTTIDTYAVVSIFFLTLLCTWHSIIGTIAYIHDSYDNLSSDSYWTWLDRYVFFTLIGFYIVVHFGMCVWHYCVPIAQRRHMEELDKRYRDIVNKNISKDALSTRSSIDYNTNRDYMA